MCTQSRGDKNGEGNASRKPRGKMTAAQTHPEVFDFWQKDILRYLMEKI